jgi:uncharacterized repeat protein (TIGR03809 family)
MTHRQGVASGRDIAERWRALAEQRLEHLTEMFETGRWRRYHSELAFLENIQEAKRAVQAWRLLAAGEDVSVVASTGTLKGWSPATLSRSAPPRGPVQTVQPKTVQPKVLQPKAVQPKAVHITPETSVPVTLDAAPDILPEITEAQIAPLAALLPKFSQPAFATELAAVPERVIEFTLNLDGIEAKYPLLRNAF